MGELGVLEEDLRVGPVAHPRPGGAPLGAADDLQTRRRGEGGVGALPGVPAGRTAPEARRVRLAAAVDLDVEAGAEGVDDARPDPVQTPEPRVGTAAELAAGVQVCEDDLDAGQARALLDVDRDAAAVVVDLHGAVGVQDDVDVLAVPARASSTALSMISHRQCMRPRESVEPMYIPGRLRTASRPSRTSRFAAVYLSSPPEGPEGSGWGESPGSVRGPVHAPGEAPAGPV